MAIRGRPFERGNKFGRGRPRGSRNQISQEARELLLTFKGTVVRKSVLEAAKKDNGDNRLLAKLLDHILRMEREQRISIGRLPTATADDINYSSAKIMQLAAGGKIGVAEAAELAGMLENRRKTIETVELAQRVRALEARDEPPDARSQH